jgi:prophage antirepressor-like protein
MSNISVFQFDSNSVRVLLIDNEPWFVATDILKALNSSTTVTALESLIIEGLGDEFVSNKLISDRLGRKQNTLLIAEPGLTFFVAKSRTDLGKAMNRWIHKDVLPSIRKTGSYSLVQEQPKRAINYYAERVMHIRENLKLPNVPCFTVIEECGHLLLEVEKRGYPVGEFDLLDGSIWKQWATYRRKELNLPDTNLKAKYRFLDKRSVQEINAYPMSEIQAFKIWLRTVYETQGLPKYLKTKYGSLAIR